MSTPIRLLIVEDREADAELMLHELQRAGFDADWQRVETEPDFQAGLETNPDLILVDWSLPQFSGMRVLQLLNECGVDIPFIIVSGIIGEEAAVDAMRLGAADYVMKDRMVRLGQAVRHALEDKQLRVERRRAEEQLRYQASLLANVSDAIIASDSQYRITAWNTAAEALYGWKAEEVLGRYGLEITCTEWPTVEPEVMRRTIAETKHWRGEATQIRRDGTRFPVELSTIVLHDESGQITGYVSLSHDITERKRVEQAVKDSEKRFRDITDNAQELIWEVDVQGKYTYASQMFEKVLGYTPQEILQKYFYDLFHPVDRESLKATAFAAFDAKQPFREFINRNVHKNGQTIWLSTSALPVLDDKGNLLGYRGADTDITERKRSEDDLRESEAMYRTLVESIPQKIFMKDRELKYLSINESFARDLGIRPADVVGKTDSDFYPKDLADHYRAVDLKILETGQTEEFEETLMQEGREIWIHCIKTPVRDEKGAIVAVLGIFWDITERKQAEIQLNEQLNELRRWYQTTMGRESRVLDLKREVNEILVKAGQPLRYPSTETENK